VYFNMRNAMEDVDDDSNYHSRVISPDLAAESPEQYGSMALRVVHSRWIQEGGRPSATETAVRLLSLFRDPPRQAVFKLHATRSEDMPLGLAVPFLLSSADVTDELGTPAELTMVPVKINAAEAQSTVTAQEVHWAVALGDPDEREIIFENTTQDIVLRTVHDALFAAPVGTETVTCYVNDGVTIGSSSTSTPSLDTGLWPAGVTLLLNVLGRIAGKPGAGGAGAGAFSGPAVAGSVGGTAIKARYAISIDNEFGEIWGGGGGGGGGGSGTATKTYGGGGGGSGAGRTSSSPGAGGVAHVAGSAGGTGTEDTGGAAGAATSPAGVGGAGGGPGLAGGAGTAGNTSSGAAGGAAGKYIDGNSFVTWVNVGDVRGGVA
jgi:hypothetical protein